MCSRALDIGNGTNKHPSVLARVPDPLLAPSMSHQPLLPLGGSQPKSPSSGLLQGQRAYAQKGGVAPALPFVSPILVLWVLYLHPLCSHRVLGCTPFISLAYFFLWFLPPFTNLQGLWYMTFYCLFQALATVSRWPLFLSLDPWDPIAGHSEVCVLRGEGRGGGGVQVGPTAHPCSPLPSNLPLSPPDHRACSGLGAASCPPDPDSQLEGISG